MERKWGWKGGKGGREKEVVKYRGTEEGKAFNESTLEILRYVSHIDYLNSQGLSFILLEVEN